MCDVFKVSTIITDIMTVDDDNFIIGGSVGILDLGKAMNEQFYHIDAISVLMKKLTRLSVDAQPFQVISFHYINVPESFDAVFSLIKGFMSEEYRMKVNISCFQMSNFNIYKLSVLCAQKLRIVVQVRA